MTFVRVINLSYVDAESNEYTPWHLDVIYEDGKYILLVMCKGSAGWILFLSTSTDNINYTTPKVVIQPSYDGWDTELYRSSIVKVNGEYMIYYSARNSQLKYHTSISKSKSLGRFIGVTAY